MKRPTDLTLAALVAAVLAAAGMGRPITTITTPRRKRAIPAVLEPPPAVDGVPHAQPAEPFSELAWRAIGPDGRWATCTILAPANFDGFEVWVTSGRGAGIVTPIRRVRSLRVARRVAHGLQARWGAGRSRAASPAAGADQIAITTDAPRTADAVLEEGATP